jgi:hypothetical protein
VKGDALIRLQEIKHFFQISQINLLLRRKLFKLIQLSFKYIALDSFVYLVFVVFPFLVVVKKKGRATLVM